MKYLNKTLALASALCSLTLLSMQPPAYTTARMYDTEMIRTLLRQGYDLNAPDPQGLCPLHYAVRFSPIDVVEALLNGEADPDVTDREGRTPLHYVVEDARQAKPTARDLQILTLLSNAGANFDSTDLNNRTPLFAAIEQPRCYTIFGALPYDNAPLITALLERGANPNVCDTEKNTPLHLATLWGLCNSTAALLQAGANAHAPNRDGQTPMQLALGHQSVPLQHLFRDYHHQQELSVRQALTEGAPMGDDRWA